MAVDFDGYEYDYSDGTWSGGKQIDPTGFESVSCTASSFCVAVSGMGLAYTYSKSTWSVGEKISPLGFQSVSCASSPFCMAVTTGNADVGHGSTGYGYAYSDGRWFGRQRIDPTTGLISAVSCASSSFCIAVDADIGGKGGGHEYTSSDGTWSSGGLDPVRQTGCLC